MSPPLSDALKQLIEQARIVSFADWQATHPPESIALFQAAETERRYLSDADLAALQTQAPAQAGYLPIVRQLRDQVGDIVDEARSQVLATFPDITQPGGGLYPAERAQACWRDFWHFLRCITYGIAGQHPHYTSQPGLQAMQQLYQELRVPLDAMVVGLAGIKTASLNRLDPADRPALTPYFDHLIAQMSQFRGSA